MLNKREKRINQLMGINMSQWPKGLWEFVCVETQPIGFCGEAVHMAVTKWVDKELLIPPALFLSTF